MRESRIQDSTLRDEHRKSNEHGCNIAESSWLLVLIVFTEQGVGLRGQIKLVTKFFPFFAGSA